MLCPTGAQTLHAAINFKQQNSNLLKQLSRSKVKVKCAHFYPTYRTK